MLPPQSSVRRKEVAAGPAAATGRTGLQPRTAGSIVRLGGSSRQHFGGFRLIDRERLFHVHVSTRGQGSQRQPRKAEQIRKVLHETFS